MSALSIDSVTGNHAGNYTCQVSNEAGTEFHIAELIVNGIVHFSVLSN